MGRREGRLELWAGGAGKSPRGRGVCSLLHPQEKGPEGERGVNSGRGGVGALLDFIFFSEPLLFELGLHLSCSKLLLPFLISTSSRFFYIKEINPVSTVD
jgi:hypothetical protein